MTTLEKCAKAKLSVQNGNREQWSNERETVQLLWFWKWKRKRKEKKNHQQQKTKWSSESMCISNVSKFTSDEESNGTRPTATAVVSKAKHRAIATKHKAKWTKRNCSVTTLVEPKHNLLTSNVTSNRLRSDIGRWKREKENVHCKM